MSERVPLTAVVLCHNEADNLGRCLEALRECSEVVVVDDGSTDGSPELARSLGARVIQHPFASFADQRNWAMEAGGLQQDWALHLDADEVMTSELLDELRGTLRRLRPEHVGFVPRKMLLGDTWLRFSAGYPVHVPRLVHRYGPRFEMRGHGEIIPVAPADSVFLRQPLLHHNFSKGWPDWWQRHERYAAAEAERIRSGLPPLTWTVLARGDRATRRAAMRALSYRMPVRPFLRFVYAYLLRCGFLDGRAGWAYCRALAAYERMIDRNLRAKGSR